MNQQDINRLDWSDYQADKELRVNDNLYIRIRKSSKTYMIRKSVNNKQQKITLGKHPALTLKKAKSEAKKYLEVDTTSTTVSTLIDDYIRDVVHPDSKVPNQVEGYLNHIRGQLGFRKAMDVKRSELVRFIKDYSESRGARSADRIRSYLKQLFNYGIELGYISGQNPMEGVTKRVTGYKPVDRERVLTADEIRMVWDWKNADHGWQKTEDNVRVIKFLLLTGLRISEAQSGYVDGDLFRVDDTKGKHPKHVKRPHWVYLTATAKALLPLPSCTPTNIQAWLKRKLLSEGVEDRFTPHDCRRTFATLANSNGVEPFIVERVLNHRMQGVMATYNHAEYEAERIYCAEVVEREILEIVK